MKASANICRAMCIRRPTIDAIYLQLQLSENYSDLTKTEVNDFEILLIDVT